MKSPFAPRSRSATSLLLLAIALLPGCGHGGGVTTTYIAVIERIEDLEGDHYSPIKGRKPLFQFHLRLARDSTRIDTGLLRVLILDSSAQPYGEVGDTVTFGCASRLPLDRVVWLDQLRGYKVVARQK